MTLDIVFRQWGAEQESHMTKFVAVEDQHDRKALILNHEKSRDTRCENIRPCFAFPYGK